MDLILKDLKIMLRIDGNEEDDLLVVLISQAMEWIEVECNREIVDFEAIPRGLKSILIDMIIFRYTVVGKEGISSENIVELSYSYCSDYPLYILRRLKRFRLLRVR